MRKELIITVLGMLTFVSCSETELFNNNPTQTNQDNQAIKDNATSILGNIDPNQNWNSITSNSVTIKADAALSDIAKIQILTESPFFNPNAKVLNEVTVTKGESATLVYDAPNVYTRLIAACVNSNGEYYITGFNIGDTQVSFDNTSTKKKTARRASADSYNFPALSNFVLPLNKSFYSYGAMRSIRSAQGETAQSNIYAWKNKDWENERFWRNNSTYKTGQAGYLITYEGSDWYMQNFSIRRNISDGLTTAEKENLEDIFNTYLPWNDSKDSEKHQKNLPLIRESTMFKLYNNQLETTGEPVIFTPVQATSTDMSYCDLYYYYYNPANVEGMTEAEQIKYIKKLPKYMAMSCYDASEGYRGTSSFFKNHEYVLPYYGDALDAETLTDYTSDGTIYRIRNGQTVDGVSYYMTNNSNGASMEPKIDDSAQKLSLQLWQIFKSSDGTSCYLYNVGAQCFIYYTGGYNTTFSMTDYLDSSIPLFKLSVENGAYHFTRDGSKGLGTDLGSNTGVWSDKTSAIGEKFNWYLEPYDGSRNFSAKASIQKVSDKPYVAKSFAIPAGYKLGLMLRKARWNNDDPYNRYFGASYDKEGNGEVFADGRLNTEINQYPNFSTAVNTYGMALNDPRVSIFSANEKTYLTFEDGIDCNFVDIILEASNGVKIVNETPDIDNEAYTLCFEDRPLIADYDLNDVVLRCTRKNQTTLVLTLVACGANDNVVIHGATGWKYNDWEVHEAFGATEADNNGNRFINTVKGGVYKEPLSAEVTVDENTTIAEYLQNIYIQNQTTDNVIKVATKGQPPYGIIIPCDFEYPSEKVSITNAYKKFANWAQDMNVDKDWYLYPESDMVYPSLFSDED